MARAAAVIKSALAQQTPILVKVTSNSEWSCCGTRLSVVKITPPRGSFLLGFVPALGPQNFFKKRLARLQAARIMRGLGGANPLGLRPARAAGLLLNSQIKTDVWALVGMVFTNYSDTTSDSLIQ